MSSRPPGTRQDTTTSGISGSAVSTRFRLPLFGCSNRLASVMKPAPLKLLFGVAIFLIAGVFAAQQNSNDAAAGEALFFAKAGCASCHEVNGRGGLTGPDLSAAGQTSSDML